MLGLVAWPTWREALNMALFKFGLKCGFHTPEVWHSYLPRSGASSREIPATKEPVSRPSEDDV